VSSIHHRVQFAVARKRKGSGTLLEPQVKPTRQDWLLSLLISLAFCGYPAISFAAVPLGITEVNSRQLTIPYRALVLCLGLLLLWGAMKMPRMRSKGPAKKLLAAFAVMYGARLLYETIANPGGLPMERFPLWAYAAGICFLSVAALLQPLTPPVRQLAPWLIWAMAFLANSMGVIHQGGRLELTERLEVTELLNPISFGQCSVTLIVFSTYLALRTESRRVMIILAISAIPGFIVFAATASRSPVLSLLVCFAFLGYAGIKRGANWKILLGLLALTIIIPVGIGELMSSGSALTTRIQSSIGDARAGIELDRITLWRLALLQFLDNPLFGRGLDIIGAGYPHNLAIEALMVTGVVGGAVFLWIQVQAIRDARVLLQQFDAAWIPLLVAQFLVLALFSGALYFSPEFWAALMLQAGALSEYWTVNRRLGLRRSP